MLAREGKPDVPAFGEAGIWACAGERGRLGEQDDKNRGTMEQTCGGEDSGISPAVARGKGIDEWKEKGQVQGQHRLNWLHQDAEPRRDCGQGHDAIRLTFSAINVACSLKWLGWRVANSQKVSSTVLVVFLAGKEEDVGLVVAEVGGVGAVGSSRGSDLEMSQETKLTLGAGFAYVHVF